MPSGNAARSTGVARMIAICKRCSKSRGVSSKPRHKPHKRQNSPPGEHRQIIAPRLVNVNKYYRRSFAHEQPRQIAGVGCFSCDRDMCPSTNSNTQNADAQESSEVNVPTSLIQIASASPWRRCPHLPCRQPEMVTLGASSPSPHSRACRTLS